MKIEKKWGETHQEMLQRYYDEGKYFYPTGEKKESINVDTNKNEEETEEYYSDDGSTDSDFFIRLLEENYRSRSSVDDDSSEGKISEDDIRDYEPTVANAMFKNMLVERSVSDKEKARRRMVELNLGNNNANIDWGTAEAW